MKCYACHEKWCEWCEWGVIWDVLDVSDVWCEWCEWCVMWDVRDVSEKWEVMWDVTEKWCELWVVCDVKCEWCVMLWNVSDVGCEMWAMWWDDVVVLKIRNSDVSQPSFLWLCSCVCLYMQQVRVGFLRVTFAITLVIEVLKRLLHGDG